MTQQTIKQAMIDGVMNAVREATANSFNVYRQGMKEEAQQDRAFDGLVHIGLAALGMLNLIEELAEKPDA